MDKSAILRGLLSAGVLLLWSGVVAPCARAQEFIYPGAQPKLSGGAGQTVSRGSSALFYNPANLIFTKFVEPDLDISYAQITYIYQHPNTDQYDPVFVKLNVPPVTAGLGIRPMKDFALGVSVLPLGTGQPQVVSGVPIGIAGGFQPVDIVTKNSAFKVAGGAAFRFADQLTIGAGAIYGSEKTQTTATPVGSSDPLLDEIYAGTGIQFTAGLRSELLDRALVFGLSYKTAVVKKYQGQILINLSSSSDYTGFTGVGYEPAEIGFGAEARFGTFGVFFDLVHQSWSAGRLIANKGLGDDGIDYLDTNDITVGLKLWILKKHMLEAAYGIAPSNLGNGTPVASSGSASGAGSLHLDDSSSSGSPKLTGIGFGDTSGVPRTIFSGGYRYKLQDTGYIELGGSYQSGSRNVPDGYAQPGFYSIQVMMVTAGVGFGF